MSGEHDDTMTRDALSPLVRGLQLAQAVQQVRWRSRQFFDQAPRLAASAVASVASLVAEIAASGVASKVTK